MLKGATATYLQVANGTGGLFVKRVSRDHPERVIVYEEEYWRHDAIEIGIHVDQ